MIKLCRFLALVCPMMAGAQEPDRIQSREVSVPVSRITRTQNIVERDGLTINLAVRDLGGSTDLSPTQRLYLTMYLKGEMFNIDATYFLGTFYEFLSITRTAPGLYELRAITTEGEPILGALPMATLRIDARQATVDMRAVRCEDGMDCPAAEKFASTIFVSRTLGSVRNAR